MAIDEQDFRLADAARIEQEFALRGVGGDVLARDLEVVIAQRHPGRLAAPARLDQLVLERQDLSEGGAGFWRRVLFPFGAETKPARFDVNQVRQFLASPVRPAARCSARIRRAVRQVGPPRHAPRKAKSKDSRGKDGGRYWD